MSRIGIPKSADKATRIALQKFAAAFGKDKSPTFASFILSDLTASRLVQTDANKKLSSVSNLASWIAGTENEIDITNDSDGTITIDLSDTINLGNSV